jgi:NADPH-dependent curcumin reductase
MARPTETRRIVLARRPDGAPRPDDFDVVAAPIGETPEGGALIRNLCLSVDPGTRSRLSEGASYAPPLKIGETIDGFAVGEVIESRTSRVSVGDLVATGSGWCEHWVFPGRGYIQLIPHDSLPLSLWIGVLGVPGMTAWFGLHRVAGLKAGDRVLVTSAAGPVGATAAQLARQMGAARVVGTAHGADKTRWLLDQAKLDQVVDYRRSDLAEALRAASPEGFDVLFDNVGNAMIDLCLPLMRPGGRIVISGQLADYNARPGDVRGLANTRYFIASRLRMEGLVVFDDLKAFPEAQRQVGDLIRKGELAYREHRYSGLDQAPLAFCDLFTASTFGRRIVDLAQAPA